MHNEAQVRYTDIKFHVHFARASWFISEQLNYEKFKIIFFVV